MQDLIRKKEIVSYFMEKGLLVSNDLLETLEDGELQEVTAILEKREEDLAVLSNRTTVFLKSEEKKLNWKELEKLETITDKKNTATSILPAQKPQAPESDSVKVIYTYKSEPKKRGTQDFIDHFNARFSALKKILRQRQELANTIAISRIFSKREREQLSVIGMVSDKQLTKNGNYMLTVEDET